MPLKYELVFNPTLASLFFSEVYTALSFALKQRILDDFSCHCELFAYFPEICLSKCANAAKI